MPLATCPACAVQLNIPDTLGPGQAIRCPKCQTVFQPGATPPPPPEVPLATAYQEPTPPARSAIPLPPDDPEPRRSSRPEVLDDEYADNHRDHRPRPTGRRWRKTLILTGAIGGSLLVVLALVLWWLLSGSSGLTDELYYAPDNSRFVFSINARGLLTSNAGQKILNSEGMKKLKQLFADGNEGRDMEQEFEKYTGLKFREVLRVTFMGNIIGDRREERESVVVVVKTINAQDFRPRDGRRVIDFRPETIGRFTLQAGGRDFCYCIVDNRTVVMGPYEAVRKVLMRERQPDLHAGLQNTLAKVDFSQAMAGGFNLRDLENTPFFEELEWMWAGHGRMPLLPGLPTMVEGLVYHLKTGADIKQELILLGREPTGRVLASASLNLDIDFVTTLFKNNIEAQNKPPPNRRPPWQNDRFRTTTGFDRWTTTTAPFWDKTTTGFRGTEK
jgi:hypothetical protein